MTRITSGDPSLPDSSLNKERKKERKTDDCALSNRVNREIYEAWLRTVPRGRVGERLTELLAKDLAEKAGKGQIVLHQSLTQFIRAEPHSTVNVVNTQVAKIKKENPHASALKFAQNWLDNWGSTDKTSVKRIVDHWVSEDPGLLQEDEFKQLLSRLEKKGVSQK